MTTNKTDTEEAADKSGFFCFIAKGQLQAGKGLLFLGFVIKTSCI